MDNVEEDEDFIVAILESIRVLIRILWILRITVTKKPYHNPFQCITHTYGFVVQLNAALDPKSSKRWQLAYSVKTSSLPQENG